MIMLAVAATFMMLDLDQLGEIVPVFVLGTIITFAIAVRRGVVSWSAMGKILIFLIVVIFLMSLEVAEVDFRTERYSNASRIINYGMALLLTALIMLPVATAALEAARGRGR
jgi:fumarate reductase subunit D